MSLLIRSSSLHRIKNVVLVRAGTKSCSPVDQCCVAREDSVVNMSSACTAKPAGSPHHMNQLAYEASLLESQTHKSLRLATGPAR